MTSVALAFEHVRQRLEEAVQAGGVDAIAHGVKAVLEPSLRGPGLYRTSETLHVYGGKMDYCHIFEPVEDGRYRRLARNLRYND